MNKYFNMNEVPIGTKVRIKGSDLTGSIIAIFHFPTTFKVELGDNSVKVYKTHEIELMDNLEDKQEDE